MSIESRAAFNGLMTNIAETQAPSTALRLADNVVLRRPGAIEQRQGFATKSPGYSVAGRVFLNSQVHGNTTVYETSQAWMSSLGGPRVYRRTGGEAYTIPAKMRADSFSTALLRGNHYMPHSQGVLSAPAPNVDALTLAGMAMSAVAFAPSLYGTPPAGRGLPAANQWAYRMVCRRTDANGYIVDSKPSGAFFKQNTSIVSQTVGLSGAVNNWAGNTVDTVRLYRTRAFPNTVQFDDEMALVAECKVVSGGWIFQDDVPDSLRGEALYTSPSRGGFEAEKDCPPAAFCVESYRGCMFCGNTIGPQRFIFSTNWSDCTGQATGVGFRVATLTQTAGSKVLTNVSPTTGLQPGMALDDGTGGVGTTGTNYITSIAGTTITMSEPQPFSGTVTASFLDAVEVNGTWIRLGYGDAVTGVVTLSLGYYLSFVAGKYEYLVSEITPAETGYQHTFVIEHIYRNGSAFTMRATHGNEMTPPLPLYGVSPASASTMDTYPNAIQWSDPDEPESVPPGNYALIAEKTKWILGLSATRDSLFIFKEDGIWRLSGYAGQWQIDPFDPTTFCILPSSIQKLNGRIIMLSNKGVVSVSELGVQPLSFSIDDQVRYLIDDVRANFATLGYYKISGVDGRAATVDDKNNEYLLNLGTVAHDLGAADVLVYSDLSSAWTTFSFGPLGGNGITVLGLGVSETRAPLIMGAALVAQADYTNELVFGQVTRRAYDGDALAVEYLGVAFDNDFSDDTARVSLNPPPVVAPGFDVLGDDSTGIDYEVVGGDDGSGHVTIRLGGNPLPAVHAPCHVYRCAPATVQPHGYLGQPLVGKAWTETALAFSRFIGPLRLSVTYSSAEPMVNEAAQLIEQLVDFPRSSGIAAHHLGTLLRADVPLDHERAWMLRQKVSWLMRRGLVSLEMIAVDGRLDAQSRGQQNSSGVG